MLNRRGFLKAAGIMGLSSLLPTALWNTEALASPFDVFNLVCRPVALQMLFIFV